MNGRPFLSSSDSRLLTFPAIGSAAGNLGPLVMQCIGAFAKYWEPGRVKTRLGEQVGMVQASRIYQGFLTTLIQRLTPVGDCRHLVFSPPERLPEFSRLTQECGAGDLSSWDLVPQSGSHLGERLQNYCKAAFDQGCSQLVVLGTDSPNLPLAYIEAAFQSLEDHDVVLGPAEDGGYYLIGLNAYHSFLFEGIPWSTSETLSATLEAASRHDLTVKTLPIWYDVDDDSTLTRLRDELAITSQNSPSSKNTDSAPFQQLYDLIQTCLTPPTDTRTSSS